MHRRRRDPRVERLKESASAHGVRGPSPKGEYLLMCPWCAERTGRPDDSYKLTANPAAFHRTLKKLMPMWHCYRCGAAGSGDLSWLGPAVQVEAVLGDVGPRDKECFRQPEGFVELDPRSLSLKPYVDYLRGRGVLEQALYVGAGACTTGYYRGRVVVPMRDDVGWCGFSARLLPMFEGRVKRGIVAGAAPRYLYPRDMDRRSSLWGLEWLRQAKDKASPAWLVEGVFDALPLFPFGLAAFGKEVTEEQLDLLVALDRPVVVCLDGDAWMDAMVLAQRLKMRLPSAGGAVRDVSWCRLPPGTDPGTLGWDVKKHVQAE